MPHSVASTKRCFSKLRKDGDTQGQGISLKVERSETIDEWKGHRVYGSRSEWIQYGVIGLCKWEVRGHWLKEWNAQNGSSMQHFREWMGELVYWECRDASSYNGPNATATKRSCNSEEANATLSTLISSTVTSLEAASRLRTQKFRCRPQK